MKFNVTRLVLALFLYASVATATSFVVPTDDELADKSSGIVVGTVEGTYVQEVDGIRETIYEIRISRSLKGNFGPRSLVRVAVPGWFDPAFGGVKVVGAPHLEVGERALLFLTSDRGRLEVTDLTLGRFRFVTSRSGQRLLARDTEDIEGWDRSGRPHREKLRLEERFLRFLADRSAGRISGSTAIDYLVDQAEVLLEPETQQETFEIGAAAALFPGATYSSWVSSQPTRWPSGGSGIVFYKRSGQHISGAADGGVSVIQAGLAAWTNECASNVVLSYGGERSTASANHDGVNVVEFNDPQGRISGSWGGSGTVAVTFLSFAGNHSFEGRSWWNITDADVVFQDGYSAANAAFTTAMTHELGHGIGFRHSNQHYNGGGACDPSVQECTTAAIMNSSVSAAYGTSLQPWDVNAVSSIYPGGSCGGTSCSAPSISRQPQSTSVAPGGQVTLSVAADGTTPLSYQWYVVTSGSASSPIAGASGATLTVAPSTTTSYWVRVSNACGSADSGNATVTVNSACTRPSITSHPQSVAIAPGGSASLSVGASGTAPLSYQWYMVTSGSASSPISGANGSTLTVTPSATTSYWVRVSNACGYADSNNATVVACTRPQIGSPPSNVVVNPGGTATLTVSASGTAPLSYQWYVVTSGSASSPISGANGASLTVAPSTTTSYWVRVINSCGHVDTGNATVVVCTRPTITSPPQSTTIAPGGTATLSVGASGSNLSYQWYVVTGGSASARISGATAATLTVSPSSTTTYWVRVANACGYADTGNATVAVCTRPAITSAPQSTTIRRGNSATLSVSASGSGPFFYQWYVVTSGSASSPVSGATGSTLTVTPSSTTSYWVRVTNACGSVDTGNATVSVTP